MLSCHPKCVRARAQGRNFRPWPSRRPFAGPGSRMKVQRLGEMSVACWPHGCVFELENRYQTYCFFCLAAHRGCYDHMSCFRIRAGP